MIISILLLVLTYLHRYAMTQDISNVYFFMSGLMFTFMSVIFLITLVRNAKVKYKKLIGFLVISDILVYVIEAMFTSSGYLSDIVLESNLIAAMLFVVRMAYILSNILLAYHLYDINRKKYIIIPILLVLAGIFLYIEVISDYVPFVYMIVIILNTGLNTWEKYNENKKRFDKSN